MNSRQGGDQEFAAFICGMLCAFAILFFAIGMSGSKVYVTNKPEQIKLFDAVFNGQGTQEEPNQSEKQD